MLRKFCDWKYISEHGFTFALLYYGSLILLVGLELPEWSRKSVLGLYVRTFGCKMEEAEVEDLCKYKCLAELFKRSLKDGARPVDPSAPVVSPADGTILSFGTVSCGQLEQVKV